MRKSENSVYRSKCRSKPVTSTQDTIGIKYRVFSLSVKFKVYLQKMCTLM